MCLESPLNYIKKQLKRNGGSSLLHGLLGTNQKIMGDVASIIKTLSCGDCARYVCNAATIHSQCCGEEGCDCECETHEIPIAEEPDIEISVSEEEGCCNCLFSRHK